MKVFNKHLFLVTLIFAAGTAAALAGPNNVAVTIDGDTYTCSKGGSGGGSACTCETHVNMDNYGYTIKYQGKVISGHRPWWDSELRALNACAQERATHSICN